MKLVNGGITIEVDPADAQRYLRAGFVRAIEQPVERQAAVRPVEPDAQAPVEAIEPEDDDAEKPVKKAKARKKETNGNN